MKRELLLLLLIIGILTSCSNDAEYNVETNNELNGNWEIIELINSSPMLVWKWPCQSNRKH